MNIEDVEPNLKKYNHALLKYEGNQDLIDDPDHIVANLYKSLLDAKWVIEAEARR